MNTEGANWF